ncbi:hypothetical protein [Brevirhabdus sp.]|uniref:hypothetical protein n=1 Tax=Brevirhabdus sp. TaxID=2004514 RepID=UPI0040599F05
MRYFMLLILPALAGCLAPPPQDTAKYFLNREAPLATLGDRWGPMPRGDTLMEPRY